MYVCRQLGGMRLQDIATLFRVGSYSTVRSVVGRTKMELDKGGVMARRLNQIRKHLQR